MEYRRGAKQYKPLKLHYIKIERYLSTGTLQVFEKRDEMLCLNGSALYILKKAPVLETIKYSIKILLTTFLYSKSLTKLSADRRAHQLP